MADGVVAELAAQARAAGRLGIDTEFMGEGRYRALLCLVQVAVETDDGVRVEVLDPLDRGVRPRAAGRAAGRPRRSRSSCTPAARTSPCCAASGRTELRGDLRHPGRRRLRRPARPARLRGAAARDGRRAPAQERVVHALGHAPAERRAGRLRARGRPAPAPARRRAAGHAARPRAPGLGAARSAARSRTPPTSASPRRSSSACRASTRSSPPSAPSPSSSCAGARRPRARPTARCPACWPTRRSSRSPSAGPRSLERLAQIRGLNESTLRRRGRAILEAVERGRERDPIPVDGDRPTPTDASDAPLIALGEALVRARASEAELAYELIAARADLQRIVTAVRDLGRRARRAHAAGLAARGGRRRAARAAAGPPLAARRPRTNDRGDRLARRVPFGACADCSRSC